ncbi:MAG TPA: cob(I)yrinic acid a,c-diamide adenosyltransferase [Patescibacteria group bacterium]|nr:cob(I)yrinic acid a,c-diamide adenosyltransferase [Patescibacteria group bacterium]
MKNKGKIYTRTGDKGLTSLRGGIRVLKTDERVEAYGMVDEFDSTIGVAIAQIKEQRTINNKQKVVNELIEIQHDLLLIGSTLANPENPQLPELKKRVEAFEKYIDEMTEELPELHNFILPGGGLAGAELHLARTICRRAERRVVGLAQNQEIDDNIRIYLNRLSDLLFTMARFVNHLEKQTETIWRKD